MVSREPPDETQDIKISAMVSPKHLDGLDELCIAIRKAQPKFRIRRSELMRAIFEAALVSLEDCDWSGVGDYEGLVSVIEKNFERGR